LHLPEQRCDSMSQGRETVRSDYAGSVAGTGGRHAPLLRLPI
jgi:hypothetical protein